MLKKVDFKNIIRSKTAVGVEVILLPENAYEINVVVLKKIKSILAIEKQKEGIVSFEELAQLIDPKLPIILVLNGKGIIHRKVTFFENDTQVTLLNKVLPNANLNEFDLQETSISSSQGFVSLIRSSIINEIIEQLKKNKLTGIVGCLLGPFVINNLLPLINTDIISNEQLRFSSYQLQIREQQITEIGSTEEEEEEAIQIGDDRIQPKLLIAFGAALSYFLGADAGIAKSELIDNIKEEFKQKQKFEFIGWSLLIAAFSVLLVNYFVFNNYWTKTRDLSSTLASNQSALNRYDTLKVEFEKKKEFLQQNGLLENSRTSFYADKLAGSLPSSIQWIDVNIHPVKKKQVNDETEGFFFENKSIKISGKCQRSTDLNDWMKEVKLKSWISSVTLLNYTQDNATDDGLFLIEIKLIH